MDEAQEESDKSTPGNASLTRVRGKEGTRVREEGGPRPATMRPRAAATPATTGDASRGISRPQLPLALRVTCVLALLVHAATWIPATEAVVSENCVFQHSRLIISRAPSIVSVTTAAIKISRLGEFFLGLFTMNSSKWVLRPNTRRHRDARSMDSGRVRWTRTRDGLDGGGGVTPNDGERRGSGVRARIGEPEVEYARARIVVTWRILMR